MQKARPPKRRAVGGVSTNGSQVMGPCSCTPILWGQSSAHTKNEGSQQQQSKASKARDLPVCELDVVSRHSIDSYSYLHVMYVSAYEHFAL